MSSSDTSKNPPQCKTAESSDRSQWHRRSPHTACLGWRSIPDPTANGAWWAIVAWALYLEPKPIGVATAVSEPDARRRR